MKRIIAGIIAMTAVMGILTGCGKDAADDAAGTSASTAAETTAAQEKTTDEEEQRKQRLLPKKIPLPQKRKLPGKKQKLTSAMFLAKMLYMNLLTLTMCRIIRKHLKCRCLTIL